jgi:hypothetical protein
MVSVAVGNRRLLALADLLEKLPRKRFDYSNWVGDNWTGDPKLSCGTTACALGWATTMPNLRRAGLRLNKAGSPYNIKDEERDELAACGLFCLEPYEARHLFMPNQQYRGQPTLSIGATPKQVARNIRHFVATRSS